MERCLRNWLNFIQDRTFITLKRNFLLVRYVYEKYPSMIPEYRLSLADVVTSNDAEPTCRAIMEAQEHWGIRTAQSLLRTDMFKKPREWLDNMSDSKFLESIQGHGEPPELNSAVTYINNIALEAVKVTVNQRLPDFLREAHRIRMEEYKKRIENQVRTDEIDRMGTERRKFIGRLNNHSGHNWTR